MKKTISSLALLTLMLAVIAGCKKKDPTPPEPTIDPYTYNSELQSSKDISEVTMILSDMEMLCAFLGERINVPKFYRPVGDPSTMSPTRDTVIKYFSISFNQTMCADGKKRNGSIFVNYSNSPANVRFYHDFGFTGKVFLSGIFEVNGWRIEAVGGVPLNLTNKVSPANYDPSVANLSWEISGKLKFTYKSDTTRNIIWDGKLTKMLVNTNDPAVFNPNKTKPIQWPVAIVNYGAQASGFTNSNVPYTASTDKPLKRDFNCSFMPPNNPNVTELHPFINGTFIFNSSNFHPRTINFGPDEPGICDNKGLVTFADESHEIDLE